MKRLLNKYKFLIITAIITLSLILILTSLFFRKNNNSKLLEYKNDNYSFQYDSNWKLEENETETILKNSNKSTISIKYILLDDETRYKKLSDMSYQLFYDIQKQNQDYHLLAEDSLKLTKNHYDGYRILLENDEKEVMVSIGKDSEKMFIITYESSSDYFDILLDSAESIIEQFTLMEEIFEISSKVNINMEPISWPNNSLLASNSGTIEDEIADYNYIVKSKLPAKLQLTSMDSRRHNYRYLGLDNQSINVSTKISPKDIYSYLEDDSTYSIYNSYKNDSASQFKEYLEESPSKDYNRYIYKNTYTRDNYRYENILLIYEINRNHTFIIEISARDIEIPKEWIEPIEIVSTKNFAGYTDTVKEGDTQNFSLKIFKDYNYEKIEAVSLRIPTRWQEITSRQLQSNIYQTRSFGIDYLSKLDYYLYRVDYYFDRTYSKNLNDAAMSQLAIEKNSMTYKYSYGKYEEIEFYKKMVVNGNEFYCYKGGYTDSNKVYVDMVLLFAKTENGLLKIKILGNNVKVSDDFLEEVSNFDENDE